MPIGSVTITVRDGSLGINPVTNNNLLVAFGTCSLGTVNQPYLAATTDFISANIGAGPLAEYGGYQLAAAGGSVLLVPVNPSVAGVSSSVTAHRVGTSTSTMTTTGAPYDAYSPYVKVVSAGTGQIVSTGNVQIQVSMDNGKNFSPAVFIPAGGTYVVPGTNVSLVFTIAASANLDAGDYFTFTCQAPFYGSGDLTAAATAAIQVTNDWNLVKMLGFPTAGSSSANATAAASLSTTMDTALSTAFNAKRFARCLQDGPPSADADLKSAYLNFTSTRIRVEPTPEVIGSSLINGGRALTRTGSWATAARLASTSFSVSPGRVASGGLLGVQSIGRDERQVPGLYDARFGVGLTYIGRPGYYTDFGITMATPGSDYTNIMNGRVIDQACAAGYLAGLQFLNSSVRVDAVTGRILTLDAVGIENFIQAAIAQRLGGDISASPIVVVNRTDNILSTQLLRITISVLPVGYVANITEDIGFINPALIPVAA